MSDPATFDQVAQQWRPFLWRLHEYIAQKHPEEQGLLFLATCIGGQLGEIQQLLKKNVRHAYTPAEFKYALAERIGHLQLYLELFTREAGIDTDAAIREILPESASRWWEEWQKTLREFNL